MSETPVTPHTVTMHTHIQSLLEHNFLAHESRYVTCIISYCKIDTSTPYDLEIIDRVDPNNRFIVTAKTLEQLLETVPVALTSFSLVPHISDCENCKKYVDAFFEKAQQTKGENEHAS